MRTPSQPDSKHDDLVRYAPRWARDPANAERRRELRLRDIDGMVWPPAEGSIRRVEAALDEFKKTLVIDGIEVPPSIVRSLDPIPVPPPPPWSLPRRPRRSAFARAARSVAVVSVAASVALLLVWQLPIEGWASEKITQAIGAISSPASARQVAVARRPAPETVPTKVHTTPWVAPVMAMAAPEPRIAEAPVAAVQKVAPTVTHAAASSTVFKVVAAVEESVRPAAPLRRIDPDEVQFLFERGEEFVAAGDFAAARIVFERAAEAGHARAAFALAATYDPLVLRRFGIKSLTADLDKARAWYEKAFGLGSAEASRRIALLASL